MNVLPVVNSARNQLGSMHTVLTASAHSARVTFSGCDLQKELEREASWIEQSSEEGQIEAAESRAVRRRRASSLTK
jgi:uncharacterized membrane protein